VVVDPVSTRTRQTVTNALPTLFPDCLTGFAPSSTLELPPLSEDTARQVSDRLLALDFDAWSEALARVGNCTHPIRLSGHCDTVDPGTGEILASYTSTSEPLGITHVRCGNRRASECPSCSRIYAGDMFHLIRAGVTGGKGVPDTVTDNPLVFATMTGPSFGVVHGRRDHGHRCHPLPGQAQGHPCVHGRPRSCHRQHGEDDPVLGQPLCPDCYDYASRVVWQWWAPDLWRRFTILLRAGPTVALDRKRAGGRRHAVDAERVLDERGSSLAGCRISGRACADGSSDCRADVGPRCCEKRPEMPMGVRPFAQAPKRVVACVDALPTP
jgi:hypothetical protein